MIRPRYPKSGIARADPVGSHQTNASVMVVFIIPSEEAAAERAGLVDGLEPFGEFRLIFQRLEVGLREGVVV